MFSDPTFWVAIAFALFVGVVLYYRVPGLVTAALDKRANQIAEELDEARRLREEAQALLASYRRKTSDADQETQDIIDRAKSEAEQLARESRENLAAAVERRTEIAEAKIAQAEANAVQEVRTAAAEMAVAAAREIIRSRLDGEKAAALLDRSIDEIRSKLHQAPPH